VYEVEQKFRVRDIDPLVESLTRLGAVEGAPESHRDTYFNHPNRDFSETREALRVRRVDGVPSVTYKGSLVAGEIKARRELEWRLDPGDADGSNMETLLTLLSFRRVGTVEKTRRTFTLAGELADFTVVVDHVTELGDFAEIELIVPQQDDIEAARDRIAGFSRQLGLQDGESRSYLTMYLQWDAANRASGTSAAD
jgi:adenylate cyclase class 2